MAAPGAPVSRYGSAHDGFLVGIAFAIVSIVACGLFVLWFVGPAHRCIDAGTGAVCYRFDGGGTSCLLLPGDV